MSVIPSDDQRHDPNLSAPDWSEGWSFYFIDPRRRLCCVARIELFPNRGSSGVTIWMSCEGKPLYHRQFRGLPLPVGDVLSGICAGGLSFRCLSLQRGRFLVSFADPDSRVAFDLDWQGLHEPADAVGMHAPNGVPGFATKHIEQLGRIVGRLTYRDQTLDLSGLGPRSHFVGPRTPESLASAEAAWVMLDDGRAFGLTQIERASGLVQLPWMWDRERLLPLYGMRFERAGDDENRPTSITLHVSDPHRRRYLLSGTRRTSMDCYLDTSVVHTGYFDFVLDDGTRGLGAHEFGHRMGETL